MKKRILPILLCLLMLCPLLFAACGYGNDDRIGTYTDGGIYTMTLEKNGRGSFVYHSAIEGDISEEIFFEIRRDGKLYINGTAESGGVVGRIEYSGVIEEKDGGYTVTLRNTETGVPLGVFTKSGGSDGQ